MSRPSKPNIYDVAERAGVSHQTVSRVINNHPSLRPATRQRVLEAMEELGYVPNAAARSLVTSRTKLVGILASDTMLFGPAGMVHAMEIEARAAGYTAVTCSVDATSEEEVRKGLAHLRRMGIEGLVVVTSQDLPQSLARETITDIPVVSIGTLGRSGALSVAMDNVAGGKKATQHLIDLGHRGILHIAGPSNWQVAVSRAEGYVEAMRAAGLDLHLVDGDWSIAAGYQYGSTLDFAGLGITAVFAANDHLALGLLKACRERGIAVPQQLSIVGFDDVPEAPYFEPPLTTVRQEFKELGQRAIQMLVQALAGEPVTPGEALDPVFVIRASTAPAPR